LCQKYSDSKAFPHTDPGCLEFENRKSMLEQEIVESNADLICLEEVDQIDFYKEILEKQGYKWTHYYKPSNVDGILIAYKP